MPRGFAPSPAWIALLGALACAKPAVVTAPTLPPATTTAGPTAAGAPARRSPGLTETDLADLADDDPVPTGDPCGSSAVSSANLSAGARVACGATPGAGVFVPAVTEMTQLEESLEQSNGGARAPILRRLAELEFAWECDSSRALQKVCALSPPQTGAADAFRRVGLGARRAAEVHCAELRAQHPTFPDQCPPP